jgi:hypothetical protein
MNKLEKAVAELSKKLAGRTIKQVSIIGGNHPVIVLVGEDGNDIESLGICLTQKEVATQNYIRNQ